MSIEIDDAPEEKTESPLDITMRAIDALEGPEEPADPVETAAAEPEEATETAPAKPRDEEGKFAKAPKDRKVAPEPSAKNGVRPQVGKPALPSPAPAPAVQPPPKSIRASVREVWGQLPPQARDELVRMNVEAVKARSELDQIRGKSGHFEETLRPYEATIRASGLEPDKYVGSLLQTAHALNYGPAPQKASVLADLVMQFGVTPQDLDQALVARMNGRPAPQQAQQTPQQFRDPRLDELLGKVAKQQEANQQRAAETASRSASEFAQGHEFFEDVRIRMANILDAMVREGADDLSPEEIEQVYNAACMSHPEVAPLFEQRRIAQAAAKSRPATQRARAAGASMPMRTASAGGPERSGKKSARDITMQAIEDLEGRV